MKYIESSKNPQVKQWKKLLTKKDRDKTGKFLIEGFHLVEEALKETNLVTEVILQENIELPIGFELNDVDIVYVSQDVMKSISDTEAPQGVAAVCEQPTYQIERLSGQQFLLIDAVQDPGNLGTMIRTADAAGIDAVVLGEGSADLYNPKVIRSTQGSLFHIPIIKASLSSFIGQLKEQGIPVYGTSLEDADPFKEADKQDSFALLVGNEGKGVDKMLLAQTEKNLYIPIYGRSESLNVAVAAGILLYHLKK
ncbi:TrmH family RNA methyltransferase [Peribacillus deserti]|uniref:TrmH family RNA methyltransferase n=1 Tax=Peribacillus deserti TaxID=673318 RepID=A0ABS2QI47_9BACI|nr:RNA methyltransferase [Peribacillus deserti]MBM7692840.1 TrmH family RNA methyltransferase [Peribacillus deserti]